ncbi:hypothetical protein [Rhizobium sullae]|uniref:hypothetical protein n=1 Tax=Rhizobium sullae TaxID=50338 RepID=UPI00104B282D|nr:hypothetical protein [Rhizobium sullae]
MKKEPPVKTGATAIEKSKPDGNDTMDRIHNLWLLSNKEIGAGCYSCEMRRRWDFVQSLNLLVGNRTRPHSTASRDADLKTVLGDDCTTRASPNHAIYVSALRLRMNIKPQMGSGWRTHLVLDGLFPHSKMNAIISKHQPLPGWRQKEGCQRACPVR